MILEVRDDLVNGIAVIFLDGESQQFVGIGKPGCETVKTRDYLLQLRSLLPQSLGSVGFIPDIGLLELTFNLRQSFRPGLIVKDTSSTHQCVQ